MFVMPSATFEKIFELSTFAVIFWLYAETHYHFRGIPSRLKKNEPEIVADTPTRLEPGFPLPILLLVKDAHLYPVELQRLHIKLSNADAILLRTVSLTQKIDQAFWHRLFFVDPPDTPGSMTVTVTVFYRCGEKSQSCINDNYRLSSHAPFQVQLDDSPLPQQPGWVFGDCHVHSDSTSDQVEFGAPLEAVVEMGKASGLRFAGITDHSYDLDDDPLDYLTNHPQRPKWGFFQKRCRCLNRAHPDFVLLPGEELSAGNRFNRNIHLLLLNEPRFYAGSGDSGERWLHTRPEWRIPDVLKQISPTTLALAAHPATPIPLLQRLLIRRGRWHSADYSHPRLDGLQIWNGCTDSGFERGRKAWISMLLQNARLSIAAGNDAHGNFNRFRQIGFPFLTFRENHREIFAQARTGVYLNAPLKAATLLEALRLGRSFVTDGPFLAASLTGEKTIVQTGGVFRRSIGTLGLCIASSQLYGKPQEVMIYIGDCNQNKEAQIQIPLGQWQSNKEIPRLQLPPHGYIRVETRTSTGCRALTNPIYLASAD
ncbi:CehA/McbA family metallohydrolase [candidate division KSB1 bacterium]|nr:CehA/McbA family metallohydrolase [candidate division KSB1 bacterium]